MKREFNPAELDVRAFTEVAGTLQGESALKEWPRLDAENQLPDADSRVQWAAHGEIHQAAGGAPEPQLHLRADVVLHLTCQRCLNPVGIALTADNHFRFVADEETAALLDEESDGVDVLALEPRLNLLTLVEDELLLALPLVPLHEVCPTPLAVKAVGQEEEPAAAPNPFAVLEQLKRPRGGS